MTGWPLVPFAEACRDVTGGNRKVPKGTYLRAGALPVVDQGQGHIAGYTNDETLAFRGRLPVIVFGDHTRRFKFVEHAFALGADGIKVLAPAEAVDAWYLYRFLKSVDLPSAGYSRHFKFLKDIAVPLPPLNEQRRVGQVLNLADGLREKRRASLSQLDEMAESLFVATFGDPQTNGYRWPLGQVGDLVDSVSYGSSAKAVSAGALPMLRMGNITATGRIDMSDLKYIDLASGAIDRFTVRRGDVLFNRTNSRDLVGKTAVYREERPAAYAGYLIRLRLSAGNQPEYLAGFLNTRYAKQMLRGMCRSIVGMANINARELQAIEIPLVPTDLQLRFARLIAALERERIRHADHLACLDALFASVQHRAFTGAL